MLIALFTIYFLGGGSGGMLDYIADIEDSVEIIMAEGERQDEALTVLKAMKKKATEHYKKVKQPTKGLEKTFRNHESTAEQIDALWAEHYATLDRYNDDMLDLRFELKEHINREEWEAIFSAN